MMKANVDKKQENNNKVVDDKLVTDKSEHQVLSLFADNRPEAVAKRNLQDTINNNSRVQQLTAIQKLANNSPRTRQLRAIQSISENGPKAQQALQLQAMSRQHAMRTLQRIGIEEEEETLQAKFEPVQKRVGLPTDPRENNTGLPDTLKAGIENFSGYAMDDVKVHYNSSKPAQLQAHAYAQGTDIHLGTGQEKHLPHEAWHVVQQKQGRVKPTLQMKGNININDDAGLEKEADVMGAKAMNVKSTMSSQIIQSYFYKTKNIQNPVVQGNFPDSVNDTRRGSQGISKNSVQMDHMVAQATLRKLVDTIKVLKKLTDDSRSKWTETKTAMGKLTDAAKKSKGTHNVFSESHLVNMQQNIVPGLNDQIGGAGDEFDPQIAKTGSGGNTDTYEKTAFSKTQLIMDNLIIKLNNLVGTADEILPQKASDTKKNNLYNDEIDELIAVEVIKLATAFDTLDAADVPDYDSDIWYDYKGKKVKKRSADWIDDESEVTIGGTDAPAKDDFNYDFSFNTITLGKSGGRVTSIPVTVEASINIPKKTWKHIYERHYLSTFKNDVQAVNTFWKQDPHTYLTGATGKALLEEELRLALDRDYNFSKPYSILDKSDSDDLHWSKSANKLFFQGNVNISITALENEEEEEEVEYYVDIDVKSIAPEDPSIAYALLPSQLEEDDDD